MKPLSIYIHIPFCNSKCNYCHFFSLVNRADLISLYVEKLLMEITSFKHELSEYCVETIYFGGGTPSLLSFQDITRIIESIYGSYVVSKSCEITIEANPESLLSFLKTNIAINDGLKSSLRFSVGLQAMQDDLLKKLGRIHTLKDFDKSYTTLEKLNIGNINVDLIFGIPGQSLKDWEESLIYVSSLDIKHISCYSLELDNNSNWGIKNKRGQFTSVSDDLDRKMYRMAVNFLKRQGFKQYEISNFAKEGFECRHNVNFWNGKDYIGFGAGAYSKVQNTYYCNPENLDLYLNGRVNRQEISSVNPIDNIILKSRLNVGLDIAELEKLGINYDLLLNDKLMKVKGGRLICTKKGFDLWNVVVERLSEER